MRDGKGGDGGWGMRDGKGGDEGWGRSASRGFTLIEVMTTLVILTVGITAVHQALVRAAEGARRSESQLYASSLAEERAVEIILDSRYGALPEPREGETVGDYHIDYQRRLIGDGSKGDGGPATKASAGGWGMGDGSKGDGGWGMGDGKGGGKMFYLNEINVTGPARSAVNVKVLTAVPEK